MRFIFICCLLLWVQLSFAAGPSCESLFDYNSKTSQLASSPAFPQDSHTLQSTQNEIQNARKASQFFMRKLTEESKRHKAAYRNKITNVDVLIIGGGPQAAAACLALAKSTKTAVVLEKTNLIAKTFAEKDFFINSVEQNNLSMHAFPGGLGTLADFTSQKYAHSSELAAHIQEQQYASGVPTLLNAEVSKVEKQTRNGKIFLLVTTNQGLKFRAKNVVLATGLGEVGTKVPDPVYKKNFEEAYLAHQANSDKIFPIMSTDTFLVALKTAKEKSKTTSLPSHLVLIGNGDGSRISIEGLSAPHIQLPPDFHITWIGNNLHTAEEYVKSRENGDRYIPNIVPFYEQNKIHGLEGHVEKVETLSNGLQRITVTNKELGTSTTIDTSMIVDSTGYDSPVKKLVSTAAGEFTQVDIHGPLPELNLADTVLAREIVDVNHSPLPIFTVGAASGSLAAPAELVNSPNKNSIAIFNTIARTSMFISQLLDLPPMQSQRGARDERPSILPAEQIIERATHERQQNLQKSRANRSQSPAA